MVGTHQVGRTAPQFSGAGLKFHVDLVVLSGMLVIDYRLKCILEPSGPLDLTTILGAAGCYCCRPVQSPANGSQPRPPGP